jgi:hypothetical protein
MLDPGEVSAKCAALRRVAQQGTPVLPVSGATGVGVPEALDAAFATLKAARAQGEAKTKSLARAG